ncbi:hypothetical protein EC973_000314 [Apophysomyces ossiformis]|uniref:Uncharacterized protein n=1 Tax=Apophysomyces ossiformis TaxID=679940 RepID=A0A8H7ENY6_9FUNG|nr:hypothetical protein EC973_000314 [Apophysomyces ossiformis]
MSAKSATHAARQAKKNLTCRRARRQTGESRGPYITAREHLRRKYAKQWVSFTPVIKGAIIHELNARQDTRPYDRNFANEPVRIFIHEAPFEADPQVVYLCDSLGEGVSSAIISRDGDLFAYQGAVDIPRITKMNWRHGLQRYNGIVSTKRGLLTAFMGLQAAITDKQAINAQIRFVVLAATCGNDYAKNLRGKSFKRVKAALEQVPASAEADTLLQTLMNNIVASVSDLEMQGFRLALHQFCRPRVSGVHSDQHPIHNGDIRLRNADTNIIESLARSAIRYRLLEPAPELNEGVIEEEDTGPYAPKAGKKQTRSAKKCRAGPSTRQAQFIRDAASGEIRDSFPEKITYPEEDTDHHITLYQSSRYVATAEAGLYSSVLAAVAERARRRNRPDQEGIDEASHIEKVMDKVVDDMSYVRYVGYHIANIAIREAYYLENDAMLSLYELFFRNDDGKTQIFCTLTASYEGIMTTRTNLFKAFTADTAFFYLSRMLTTPLERNVLLKARKLWHQDCSAEMCIAPTPMYMGEMVTEIANGASVDFRKNIVYNFKHRYCDYLQSRLKEVARVPVGWPAPDQGRFDEFIQDITNSVHDGIQHIAAEERQPRFQYIAEANIREQVNKFVTNMVNRYKNAIEAFDGDRCRLEVENHATVPQGWSRNRDKLIAALFQRIWGMSVDISEAGADQEDLEEQEQDQEEERQGTGDILAGLANDVHTLIEDFITAERNLQVKGIRVSEVNLSECLSENGRQGTNGGNDDEDDEDDVLHRTYGGKLSKARAARLTPFTVYFLERREGNSQSFVLCPLQAHHRIAIPFNLSFTTTLLTRIEHFSRPIIQQLEQELTAGPNDRRIAELTRERDNLRNACVRLQGIKSRDSFSALFDIRRQATITRDGGVDVRDRDYMRWLNQRIPGNENKLRFSRRRVFRTDGVRLYCIYNDWLRSRRGNTTCKYLTELRRTIKETLKDTWQAGSPGNQYDYLQHYDGIVGLDFGEAICMAQLFQKKRDWLEARKAANNIDDIEAALSEGSPRSTYDRYREYLR